MSLSRKSFLYDYIKEVAEEVLREEHEHMEVLREEVPWGKKKCNDCKEELPSFCRTIDKIDYCLSCAPKHEKN